MVGPVINIYTTGPQGLRAYSRGEADRHIDPYRKRFGVWRVKEGDRLDV